MLSRDRLVRMQFQQLLDACCFAVSFWLAYALRTNETIVNLFRLEEFKTKFAEFVGLWVVLIVAAPIALEAQGFYDRPILCRRRVTAWRLFRACVVLSLIFVTGSYFLRLNTARFFVIWFGVISFILAYFKEELVRFWLTSSMAQAQVRRGFIVLGPAEEAARLRSDVRSVGQEEIQILAELDLEKSSVPELVQTLHEYSANGVIISARQTNFDQVELAISACELEGVEVWLVADFFRPRISRTTLDDFYGRPVFVFRSAPGWSWQGLLKQILDFVLAAIMSLVGLPFFLLIALLIKITSPGPVLFRQQRSGLNGRPFTLYKFRTMVTNAEQLKHELAAMNEMTGPVFKVTNDPRVTPIGRFLRKYSLDEFPQLYNVLRGEMSLVGPRPLPVDEVRQFNDLAHRRRLSVKPGLTCLWQISGRNEVRDFRDWVRLDLEYIDNWSLWLDLKILWRTVPIVITGVGAK